MKIHQVLVKLQQKKMLKFVSEALMFMFINTVVRNNIL